MEEYLISFSSFYKAAYAQDTLDNAGISSTLRKLPTELMRSCSTGLYLRTDDIARARDALGARNISSTGIYRVKKSEKGNKQYIRIR